MDSQEKLRTYFGGYHSIMDDEKVTNLMDAYIIENSIKDVLAILDSAPIQPDLLPERNLVQLTNRIPIAHLAIERGIKGLINRAGGGQEETHSLGKLYDILKIIDTNSAEFLATAFEDAVSFYGYNPKRSGFEHFQSIVVYFSRVGGKKAFDALRYWAIGDPGTGETAIKFISPPIHREILWALRSLLISRPETTSERVDSQIGNAMWRRRFIDWTNDDEEKRTAIELYRKWLMENSDSLRDALRTKLHCGIPDFSHEYIAQVFNEGWEDFQQSKDPAVRYYMNTLNYLQRGSQQRDPSTIPDIEWLRDGLYGQIKTHGGDCLGFVEKCPDGAWAIHPLEEGLAGVKAFAWALRDAKSFLVNRVTKRVRIEVDGRYTWIRMLTRSGRFPLPTQIFDAEFAETADPLRHLREVFTFEFWSNQHGLSVGDAVVVEFELSVEQTMSTYVQGVVVEVHNQVVSIDGVEGVFASPNV